MCKGAALVFNDAKVIKALLLSSLLSMVRERALKEFLKTMGVAGDKLHQARAAFAELKKAADLAVSKEASLLLIGRVQQASSLVWKAGQGVGALACGRSFEKDNFMSWTWISTIHLAASKSRSWALVFQVEYDE